jgi:hypothetical protein
MIHFEYFRFLSSQSFIFFQVIDLWEESQSKSSLGTFTNEISLTVPKHGVRILKFIERGEQGFLVQVAVSVGSKLRAWGTSGWSELGADWDDVDTAHEV